LVFRLSLLPFHILSEGLGIGIYKIVVLLVVLYGCEIWSITIREDHGLRVFESGVVGREFGPLREGVAGAGDCMLGSFMTCTHHQMLLLR